MKEVKDVKTKWGTLFLLILACGFLYWFLFPQLDGSIDNGVVANTGNKLHFKLALLVALPSSYVDAYRPLLNIMLCVLLPISLPITGNINGRMVSKIPWASLYLTNSLIYLTVTHLLYLICELIIKIDSQPVDSVNIIAKNVYQPYIFGIVVLSMIIYVCLMVLITLYSRVIQEYTNIKSSVIAWTESKIMNFQREENEIVCRLEGSRGDSSKSYDISYWYFQVLRLITVLLMFAPTVYMYMIF